MTEELIAFAIAFALWIAAVLYSAVGGLVLLKDRRWLPGVGLVLLALVLLVGGCTWLYQLGEVP